MKSRRFTSFTTVGLVLIVPLIISSVFQEHISAARVTFTNGQTASLVLGHADFTQGSTNSPPTASSMRYPNAVAIDPTSGTLFVSDSDNARILRFASSAALVNGAAADGVLGQADFTRGASTATATTARTMILPGGITVDSNGRLWVADTGNNRVLRFDHAASKPNGAAADGVLGQSNFISNTFTVFTRTASSMTSPGYVAVDKTGRLWVTDAFNKRILRFDNAASKPNGAPADGVLGQPDFISKNDTPTGELGALAVDSVGHLWVASNNRVLRFDNVASKPNGAPADGVLGQADFTSEDQATTANGMKGPSGIVVDGVGRLWVSDYGNNRLLRFDNAANKLNGAAADGVLGQIDFTSYSNPYFVTSSGMYGPRGIAVDGENNLWIADHTNDRVLRFDSGESAPFLEPVIFIPGIAGSYLIRTDQGTPTYVWPGLATIHNQLSLYPSSGSGARTIVAGDVIRYGADPVELGSVYGPLLKFLTHQGYVEYDLHNVIQDPQLRGANCKQRDDQSARKPTLFVFAYDWRLDNAANAEKLADYVTCVRSYYPNHKVALLAHSMGGLIARRYILKHSDAPISTLITIGTPWLGSPKAVYGLATGDLALPPIVRNSTIKAILGSFKGASQLLPSQNYYAMTGAANAIFPFREDGWDVNENHQDRETYTYPELVAMLDTEYGHEGFRPGSDGQTFHNVVGQDDWSHTTDTILYYHLIGIQGNDQTIGQVLAHVRGVCDYPQPQTHNGLPECPPKKVFDPVPTRGDGTVPYLSASRALGGDENSPHAFVINFSDRGGNSVEHTALPSNPYVQQKIFEILQSIAHPMTAATSAHRDTDPPIDEPSQPATYLSLYGITTLTVRDPLGNSTEPVTPTAVLAGSVPGVSTLKIGEDSWWAVLAQSSPYTVTFHMDATPMALDIRVGTAALNTRHMVYSGMQFPQATGELTVAPDGALQLRYDTNGDGVMDVTVPPTLDVSGTLAGDTTPPQIAGTFQHTSGGDQLVLNVADAEHSVASVLYAADGQHFTPYTEPIALTITPTTQITVIATDTAGNQAGRVLVALPYQLYTPYLSR